jgi:thiosulfate/3-mercaptopyruvate sulfurtransferase
VALALHQLGAPDVAVYDGSWSEWGGRSDTPIET